MAIDFKKIDKLLYKNSTKPFIINVPKMNFIAVRGEGNPNTPGGEYEESIKLLYSIAYTIKMSKNTNFEIPNYFDFVVPPLEGFWWQKDLKGYDKNRKDDFSFISLIRMPDFVSKEVFLKAKEIAAEKKKINFERIEFFTYDEGTCVQCMHIGHYDNEPETLEKMYTIMQEQGFELDISDQRYHHEIYLSDPRKVETSKLKTIIRHPIKKII